MNRMTKELRNRGIIFDADEYKITMYGMEYDNDQKLVGIYGDVIVAVWFSAVMDPEFRLYDRRTLELIGGQDLLPYETFTGSRTWGSWANVPYEESEVDEVVKDNDALYDNEAICSLLTSVMGR